jgi:hypothetical protein
MSLYLQAIAQTATLDPNLLNKHFKLEQVARFNELRLANPRLKQNEIAHLMGTSDSTLKRIRKDLGLGSAYRYDIPVFTSKKKINEEDKVKEENPKKTRGRKKKSETIQLTNNRNRSKTPNKKDDYGGTEELPRETYVNDDESEDIEEILKQVNINNYSKND